MTCLSDNGWICMEGVFKTSKQARTHTSVGYQFLTDHTSLCQSLPGLVDVRFSYMYSRFHSAYNNPISYFTQVYHLKERHLDLPPHLLTTEIKIIPRRRRNLMHPTSLLPSRAPPLDNSDQLLGDSLRQHVPSAAAALFLARRVEHPHECRTPPLPQTQGHRDLQRHATACCAALGADAQQRSDAVERESQVEDWV